MRKLSIAATAAAISVLASAASAADLPVKAPPPPTAPAGVSGYVEFYTGGARTEVDSKSMDGWALGGAGRVTYWWALNGSLQLDAQGDGTSYHIPDSGEHISAHGYLIGAHLNWRDPQRGLIGIFGGAGDSASSIVLSPVRHAVVGGEVQWYLNALTLYGQAGYDRTVAAPGDGVRNIHAWFVRGTGRVYFTPNFRLEGTVVYADGSAEPDGTNPFAFLPDFKTWLWRAKAEYKFMNAPFALFAAYEGSRSDFGDGFLITDHRVVGGFRLYLGEPTLQFNDRQGTTLDIIDPLGIHSLATCP